MVSSSTVTAIEELQRYYRKAKAVAQPVVDKMMPQDETNEPKATAGDEAVEELFNEEAAEVERGWVEVVGSEETPTVFSQHQSSSKCILTTAIQENNQENHRLATGTGPIEVASANLLLKMSDLGAAAAAKASQAPTVTRTCAENQVERLAEGVGRVTVSETVSTVLQRYPLLERWRLAFSRGRNRGGQEVITASPPVEARTSCSEKLHLAEELPFCLGEEEMEDVPLGEEQGKGQEDWEEAA
jgi:hypothetical protein